MTRKQWIAVCALTALGCGGAVVAYREAQRNAERSGGSTCIQDMQVSVYATCLLLKTGRAHCFGDHKRLGKELPMDPVTFDLLVEPDRDPVQTDVRFSSIHVGLRATCGLRQEDGSVWCWGEHQVPRAGAGVRPIQYPELGKGNKAVASLQGRVCVINRESAVACFTQDNELLERLVEDAVELTGYNLLACARTRSGEVWCWGGNDVGELGRGTTSEGSLTEWTEGPGRVLGLPARAAALRVFRQTACAITEDRAVWCWGSMNESLLGNGLNWYPDDEAPFPPQPVPVRLSIPPVRDFAPGHCYIPEDGSLWCWGSRHNNRLLTREWALTTDGRFLVQPQPTKLAALGNDNVSVRMAENVCVQKTDGSVWCWGDNYHRAVSREPRGPEDGDGWRGLTRKVVDCTAE